MTDECKWLDLEMRWQDDGTLQVKGVCLKDSLKPVSPLVCVPCKKEGFDE